jgi:predicted nucleic acid-binding protein
VGVDEKLAVEAAKIKHKYYSVLSLADAFLIALVKQSKATIVTTDHSVKKAGFPSM